MSDPERIDLKQYIGEQFAAMRAELATLRTDVNELKDSHQEAIGRRKLYAVVGKAIALITATAASIAALFGPPWH